MIVVMRRGAKEEDIQHMIKQVESLGLKPTVLRGTERTVIAAIGDERMIPVGVLESGPSVDEVLPVLAPYKLASVETKSEPTVVRAGSLTVGGGHLGIIAGPCSVESEEQIVSTAQAVKAAGATALRGGAYKPRTSPYSFQGMKEKGLQLLAQARAETGLSVVTEVVAAEDIDVVAEYADVLQIGARNMQNFALLKNLGKCGRPILLKRGMSSTVKELLMSAEYIVAHGNPAVMLCERGIRTFETVTRNTCDIGAIAALNELTHLPVILDPSHATGKRSLVPAVARCGPAVGADGLIVEMHPNPEKAMSDGAQSLDPQQFARMMADLKPYIELWKQSRAAEVAAV